MTDNAVTFKYDQLFAGEVDYITRVKTSAATYKPGTILVSTDGKKYAAAKSGDFAVPAVATSTLTQYFYAVCVEDVTTADNGEAVCVKQGYFNKRVVEAANAASIITADAVEILKVYNIFLVDTVEQ